MNVITQFIKNYFLLSFILLIISYLSPREEYRKYFQFFIGALMAIVLFRPLLSWDFTPEKIREAADWNSVRRQIEGIYYEDNKGVNFIDVWETEKE